MTYIQFEIILVNQFRQTFIAQVRLAEIDKYIPYICKTTTGFLFFSAKLARTSVFRITISLTPPPLPPLSLPTTKMVKPSWAFVLSYFIIPLNLHPGSVFATIPADPLAQQKLDKVLKLPGQTFNLSFAHYAGYATVNEDSGRALFYWFVEAAEDPESKPIVLWLNGG